MTNIPCSAKRTEPSFIRIRCPCCDEFIRIDLDTGEATHGGAILISEKKIPHIEFGAKEGDEDDEQ